MIEKIKKILTSKVLWAAVAAFLAGQYVDLNELVKQLGELVK
jgi:acid phosphatase family membrane protein YuiD